jgi:hypothetical protein
MQVGDLVIVRCPMGSANRQLQNGYARILTIWDLGRMADVRLLSGAHKGERWQFVVAHLRRPNAPREPRQGQRTAES